MTSTLFVVGLALGTAFGKPPPGSKTAPAPSTVPASPTHADSLPESWLRLILEQNGSGTALAFPWAEIVQSMTGQQVISFKPSDSVDAAVATKIGTALDGILPKLNRPDGPVRLAKRVAMIPPLVEEELLSALTGIDGLSCKSLSENTMESLNGGASNEYPGLQLTDQTSHRVYYLGVGFCALDSGAAAQPLLHADPRVASARITANGVCLLVVLEHNGKTGTGFAFMNWKIIDLSQGKVRLQTAFTANAVETILPAATIGAGRRGRD